MGCVRPDCESGHEERSRTYCSHRVHDAWETTLLDKAEDSVPVVWSESPGEYEGVYHEKKIRALKPVIVLCGYSSWAIVYAWTGGEESEGLIKD